MNKDKKTLSPPNVLIGGPDSQEIDSRLKHSGMTNDGQSLIEYSVLTIVILAVFLAMNMYVKRGIQGRWKAAVDEFGDQYDPRVANSLVNYVLKSASNTMVDAVTDAAGQKTIRTDTTNSVETKGGQTTVFSVQ